MAHGIVVRVLTSHQRDMGLIPGISVKRGLSL